MSSTNLRASLRQLGLQRSLLLRRLAAVQEVAVGSVSVVARKCGKPNCHCAQGGGHNQTLFLFRGEDGRRHCKLIRQADSQKFLSAGDRYREFRAGLKELKAINERERRILETLMERQALHYE